MEIIGNPTPYSLGPKASWYYWFYLPGAEWRPYGNTVLDARWLNIVPRARSYDSSNWNGVLHVHTRIILEVSGGLHRYSYRVLVENPTDSTVYFDFLASVT